VLTAKGDEVHYSESNGNHSYVAWRLNFGERLIALVGKVRKGRFISPGTQRRAGQLGN